MTKREHKRQPDNKNIMTDDESEFGDTAVQKRGKRTKQKDDRLEVSFGCFGVEAAC